MSGNSKVPTSSTESTAVRPPNVEATVVGSEVVTDEEKRAELRSLEEQTNAVMKAEINSKFIARGELDNVVELNEEEAALVAEYEKAQATGGVDAASLNKLREQLDHVGDTEPMQKVENPQAEALAERNELLAKLAPMEAEHRTHVYEDTVKAAIEALWEENKINRATGETKSSGGIRGVERHSGKDEVYVTDDRVQKLLELLENNEISAAQFVLDMEKFAFDVTTNGETSDGKKITDLFGKFLPSIPDDIRNQEGLDEIEAIATEAKEERTSRYDDLEIREGARLGAMASEVFPPYKKKDAREMLEDKALSPDVAHFDFVEGLLHDAKEHLKKVADSDMDKRGGLRGLFRGNKQLVYEQRLAANIRHIQQLAAMESLTRRIKNERHSAVDSRIDRSEKRRKKVELRKMARRVQGLG